jgi:hypothetical protein
MLKKFMILFAVAALAFASANTYTVTLFQPSVVNGKELQPGDYKLQVTDNKVVISKGKESVEATVKVENGDQKYSSTAVRYTNGDGKYKLQEIRLGGTKTRLVFSD